MSEVKIAVIGGSGFYNFLEECETITLTTPFGKTPKIEIGWIKDKKVAFLSRHSKPGSKTTGHNVPPHLINYKANIYGLRKLGVERIIAVNSCGVINPEISPGDIIVIDQFIDFTKKREGTFYDGKTAVEVSGKIIKKVVHVDLTEPFCPDMRRIFISELKRRKVNFKDKGVYLCTEGPRFETPAEIVAFRKLGADLVGMTLCPEVILARELAMCYVSCSIATNLAAGLSDKKITLNEVLTLLEEKENLLKLILKSVIPKIPEKRECICKDSLKEYIN